MTTTSFDISTAVPPAKSEIAPALQKIVLEPTSKWRAIDFAEIWRYRDLLCILTMREIQVRYKQTMLGALWAVVQPLLTTGIFAVLLALLMGKGNEPGVAGVPYVVSTFCAMLPWQLFANSLAQAGGSLVASQRLITKVYFPRLIIPLSAVLGALADFAVAFAALLGVMLWYGVRPSWAIVTLPAFVVLALSASLAFGLWLSALTAMYRDFRHIVPFIVQIGMFVSPVIYTTQKLAGKLPAWAMVIYGLNPMAGVIEGFRWALLGSAPPSALLLVPSILMTTVILIGGAYYFKHMERTFADVV
jgi:lipopolysaccharide transport system permease protein